MSFASRLLKKLGGQVDHDPNNAPPRAYYPPPPVSPYRPLAPAPVAPPPRTAVAPTIPSPPPLPARQQSSPQQFTSIAPNSSPSLQPYGPPTQQGWLADAPPSYFRQPSPQPPPPSPSLQSLSPYHPPAPYLRQPSPQLPPISSSVQSSPTPQSLADTQPMGVSLRQRSARREPPQVRKILSLDGGGVRGLSIITILKYIMRNLNRERGFDLEPWEEFDMIGGTSTGG